MAQDFDGKITQYDLNLILTKLTNLYNTYRQPNVINQINLTYQPPASGVSINDKIVIGDLTTLHAHYKTKIGNLNNPDLGMPSQGDIILDDPFESLYNAIEQINFIQQQPCYSCDQYGCPCQSSCDIYSCDCHSICDGYSCDCDDMCHTFFCSCNSTCYVESCTCDYSYHYGDCLCYGACYEDLGGGDLCGCYMAHYYLCGCDATCYLESCNCNSTCDGYSCDCHNVCFSHSYCGCDESCDIVTCSCEGSDTYCAKCYSQSYVCSTGY